MSDLAKAIRAARGNRTRREFAKVIKSTEGNIYGWERGTHVPRVLAYINALAKAGVPRDLLEAGR